RRGGFLLTASVEKSGHPASVPRPERESERDGRLARLPLCPRGGNAPVQSTMKAVRYYGPGQPLRLEDVPRPRLATGEALLKVRAAGVCHTELHLLDGVLNLGVTPLIPGHEVVADVVETRGASALAPGQRVLLWYYAPCGACAYCRGSAENLCPNTARQFGFTADGGYAEYLVAPVGSLIPLPEN